MPDLQSIFCAVGILTVSAVVLFSFAVFLDWCSKMLDKVQSSKEARIRNEAEEEYRQIMHSDAYWFSEDVPTMNLLKRLADGECVSEAREKWRRDRQNTQAIETER